VSRLSQAVRLASRPATVGALVLAALGGVAGCSDSSTAPGRRPGPNGETGPVIVSEPVASAGAMTGLVAESPLALASRFVLYPDGELGLQFSSPVWGFFEYGGRYARTDSVIAFTFDNGGAPGPWLATGTLGGERLSVKYNELMSHSDFRDGVYVRASSTR